MGVRAWQRHPKFQNEQSGKCQYKTNFEMAYSSLISWSRVEQIINTWKAVHRWKRRYPASNRRSGTISAADRKDSNRDAKLVGNGSSYIRNGSTFLIITRQSLNFLSRLEAKRLYIIESLIYRVSILRSNTHFWSDRKRCRRSPYVARCSWKQQFGREQPVQASPRDKKWLLCWN